MVALPKPRLGSERAPTRIADYDRVRACAIIAVIAAHALPASARVPSILLGFHVPAFLLISGTLSRCRGASGSLIRRRVLRVVVPYLVAAAACYLFRVTPGTSFRGVAIELVTGSTLGVYYFVPVIVGCVLLVWPLSRIPRIVIVLVALSCFAYVVALPFARGSRSRAPISSGASAIRSASSGSAIFSSAGSAWPRR